MGIPLWKAVEVTLIWLVAVLFAVPEALAFDMLEIPYRGKKLRVCLLHPEQTTSFMKVIRLLYLEHSCSCLGSDSNLLELNSLVSSRRVPSRVPLRSACPAINVADAFVNKS